MQFNISYSSNLDDLFESLGADHHPPEWRLFVDSSAPSLKVILLLNGDEMSFASVMHAVGLKDAYDTVQHIMRSIIYCSYHWSIFGDLQVIGLLFGMQMWYLKHQCFLCHCNSSDCGHD